MNTMISTRAQATIYTSSSKPNLSTQRSCFLEPCTQLSFNTHFPRSTFPLKTHPKSIRTTQVKAAATTAIPDTVYVNTQSFYELLGISESGTLSEIKKAYKQLARKYHPDVSPPDRTEEYTHRFIQVQEAYETLSDPESRALYDRDMSRGLGLHAIFGARKRSERNFEDRSEWEDRWQSQLSELIRRSNSEDDSENMSWGARMRCQRRCSN